MSTRNKGGRPKKAAADKAGFSLPARIKWPEQARKNIAVRNVCDDGRVLEGKFSPGQIAVLDDPRAVSTLLDAGAELMRGPVHAKIPEDKAVKLAFVEQKPPRVKPEEEPKNASSEG